MGKITEQTGFSSRDCQPVYVKETLAEHIQYSSQTDCGIQNNTMIPTTIDVIDI